MLPSRTSDPRQTSLARWTGEVFCSSGRQLFFCFWTRALIARRATLLFTCLIIAMCAGFFACLCRAHHRRNLPTPAVLHILSLALTTTCRIYSGEIGDVGLVGGTTVTNSCVKTAPGAAEVCTPDPVPVRIRYPKPVSKFILPPS